MNQKKQSAPPAASPTEPRRDPDHVVWHRSQTITTVRGPEGKLRFKAADLTEAEQMYRELFDIDPADKTIVIQAESKERRAKSQTVGL